MPNTVTNGSSPKKATEPNMVTSSGTEECLLGAIRGPQAAASQIMPLSAFEMQSMITNTPMIKIKKTISCGAAPMSMIAGEATDVHVADIKHEHLQILKAQNSSRMIIEKNEPLSFVGSGLFSAGSAVQPMDPAKLPKPARIKIRVLGKEDKPLPNARIMLQGAGMQQTGITDKKGEATVELWSYDGEAAKSLWIKPRNNHWDLFLERPNLVDTTVNIVRLQAFSETVNNFPETFNTGWGLDVMGLKDRPEFARGRGVKIAIIDSGCDTSHPLLNHIKKGFDASTRADADAWKTDTIGHGTHVAGVITANGGENGTMMTGFAPDAEIHVISVFPGGYSSLIEALNYCIENRIDVANMSLGGAEISKNVEQKIQEATLAGVACIVAAGNSGDSVKFPASSPNTLAVAAVGNTMSTRKQSWANTQVVPNSVANDGTFAAKFSCHGPEINVCAPGVAIVSTLPDEAFGTDDGTSMATPHIAGIASLLLAHSPLFRDQFVERNAERVTALFSVLRDICRSHNFEQARQGSGLPTLSPAVYSSFVPSNDEEEVGQTQGHFVNGSGLGTMSNGPEMHTMSAFPQHAQPHRGSSHRTGPNTPARRFSRNGGPTTRWPAQPRYVNPMDSYYASFLNSRYPKPNGSQSW